MIISSRRFKPLLFLAALVVTIGCDDDDDPVDPGVVAAVAAFRDPNVNFPLLHTFAMPDTVVHFAPATGTPIAISREHDRAILDRVRINFLARGFTLASTAEGAPPPDFLVFVGTTATQNHAAWVTYPWFTSWGFYPALQFYAPGFDATWGIVYPWAPVAGVTAYERGSVIVELIPTLSVQPVTKTVRAAWAGAATGLMNGAITTSDVIAAIDEMFVLSPYLRTVPPVPVQH